MNNNEKLIEEFRLALVEYVGLFDKQKPARLAVQAEFDAIIQAEWRVLFGRKKYKGVEASKLIPKYEELIKPFQARANKLLKDHTEERAALTKQLDDLAEKIEITNEHIYFEAHKHLWSHYGGYSTSDYNSQGFGAAKYAKASAEGMLDHVQQYIEAEIREVRREPTVSCGYSMDSVDYQVWAACDKIICEVIRRKPGLSLRAVVKKLLKRGANPRVSIPLLPAGYEASVGLDYFGNDVKKGETTA